MKEKRNCPAEATEARARFSNTVLCIELLLAHILYRAGKLSILPLCVLLLAVDRCKHTYENGEEKNKFTGKKQRRQTTNPLNMYILRHAKLGENQKKISESNTNQIDGDSVGCGVASSSRMYRVVVRVCSGKKKPRYGLLHHHILRSNIYLRTVCSFVLPRLLIPDKGSTRCKTAAKR